MNDFHKKYVSLLESSRKLTKMENIASRLLVMNEDAGEPTTKLDPQKTSTATMVLVRNWWDEVINLCSTICDALNLKIRSNYVAVASEDITAINKSAILDGESASKIGKIMDFLISRTKCGIPETSSEEAYAALETISTVAEDIKKGEEVDLTKLHSALSVISNKATEMVSKAAEVVNCGCDTSTGYDIYFELESGTRTLIMRLLMQIKRIITALVSKERFEATPVPTTDPEPSSEPTPSPVPTEIKPEDIPAEVDTQTEGVVDKMKIAKTAHSKDFKNKLENIINDDSKVKHMSFKDLEDMDDTKTESAENFQ